MKHKYARERSSELSHAMQTRADVEPHLHLLCICHLRGQNMQSAPTPIKAFKKKKISLKLDSLPTAQRIFLILEERLYFKKNRHLFLISKWEYLTNVPVLNQASWPAHKYEIKKQS